MATERDYILGTHDDELDRLGLQHRVWQPTTLRSWQDAGITSGSHVLDLGAGPGYASADLAEIVGPTGSVTALERSTKFVQAAQRRFQSRSLENVRLHELDLMIDDLPQDSYDFSWCRWVASFVTDPSLLVQKLGRVMRPGGVALFFEYAHYLTWRFIPRVPSQERFAEEVKASWAAAGGKADIGLDLPRYLVESGFAIRLLKPHVFCVGPQDYMWHWPVSFIATGLARLQELDRVDAEFASQVQRDVAAAAKNPAVQVMMPLVLEIVAEKKA